MWVQEGIKHQEGGEEIIQGKRKSNCNSNGKEIRTSPSHPYRTFTHNPFQLR